MIGLSSTAAAPEAKLPRSIRAMGTSLCAMQIRYRWGIFDMGVRVLLSYLIHGQDITGKIEDAVEVNIATDGCRLVGAAP